MRKHDKSLLVHKNIKHVILIETLRASASVSIVKIKFLCHVIKLTIHFKSDIPE
jgi:hypothetical protein